MRRADNEPRLCAMRTLFTFADETRNAKVSDLEPVHCVGRVEEHKAEMRASAFRFATAFAGLLVAFVVALIFRNSVAALLQP